MKRIIISEEKFNKIIKLIKEQEESDIFEINAEQFYNLAGVTSFNLDVLSKLKKIQGKPIKVVGDLDLSGNDVKTLGNVIEVTGDLNLSGLEIQKLNNLKRVGGTLNISNSKVGDVREVEYNSIIKWGSTLYKLEIARQEREKRLDADQRREENVWDLNDDNISDIGLKANALFDHLVYYGILTEISDEQKEVLESFKSELEELNDRYENAEDSQEINLLRDRITDLEIKIEEIIENTSDVYSLIPNKYSHYGLTIFQVLGMARGAEFAVGTEEETEAAALEYAKSFIGEVGLDGFRKGFIDDYVDGEEVADYFEDSYREMIYDSPESYFDDDELGLTQEQEERIEWLEEKISELEETLQEYEGEHDDQYYKIQEVIDELQEELDSIEPSGQPTDDMVEEKLEEIMDDIRRNPVSFLKDYGYDIENFIDIDVLSQGLVDEDGYGIISSYDGDYDTQEVNDVTYYIFRIN